jgi:two-component system, NtrC family, response regulator HydG
VAPVNKILAIDDDRAVLNYLQVFFTQSGRFQVRTSIDSTTAAALIEEFDPDLILLDIDMPDVTGIDILNDLYEKPHKPEVIVLSGVEDIKLAVRAMKLGAYDYLTKPIDTDKLLATIDHALERRNLKSEIRRLRRHLEGHDDAPFARIVTRAPQMQEVFDQTGVIAPTDNSVLVWGESGTGKELLARSIHTLSKRASAPFVPVNAGVFASELFASEFFGHAKGAFTGAVTDTSGILAKCNHGTLFLDEIGELSLAIQVKLLRVLQDGEYFQVGSTRNRQVDVRIITATNKDLREEIERGSFRPDLFYRLNVCSIFVPPLREREGDIPFLAQYFVEKYAQLHERRLNGISEDVLALLQRYRYPGNVRELENIINSAVLLESGHELTRTSLPQYLVKATQRAHARLPTGQRGDSLAERTMSEVEREHVERVLRHTSGNRTAAAKILGLSRVTLISKIKQYKLEI